MSDLNEKLLELLEEMGEDYYPLHEYPESYEPQNIETRKKYLAKIKQAFADAGYVEIPNVLASVKDGREVFHVNNKVVMTGQEWYERFEKELQGKPFVDDHHENAILRAISQCYEAAKRAAGISND